MNISFIEGFLEAARLKSLAKASEKLKISHPALSKQINSMEQYYGINLFHRSSSGVTLTEYGKILYDRILPVYSELIEIKSDLKMAAESTNYRSYRIGTLPSLASGYLPNIVLELKSSGINVEIDVRDTSDELEELLNQGKLHAAVIELQPHHVEHWNIELFEEPYDTVIYSNHRFSNLRSVSIQEIGLEPLILNPPNCTIRRLFSNLIEDQGMQPIIGMESQYGDFILGYVATGAGITFAPRMGVEQILTKGLQSIPIDDPRAKRVISLACVTKRIGETLQPYFTKK